MEVLETEDVLRFIGNEFLMWLWFKTDCYDGLLPIAGHGDVEVIFDDHLRLDAYLVDAERSDFKGGAPAYAPEAKTALRQAKRPSKAKLRVTKDNREWVFSFTGDTMDFSGIKAPGVLSKEDDEQFYERMYLIEELEEIMEILYQEFVKIRISPEWQEVCIPSMKDWIYRDEKSTLDDYPEELKAFAKGTPKITLNKNATSYTIEESESGEDELEEGDSDDAITVKMTLEPQSDNTPTDDIDT